MSLVAENLALVRARIDAAAREAGRDPSEVRLVAVSKKKPTALVREAYEAGQRDFGENYVQELLAKAEECADLSELRWHMIGHLQRNKVKPVLRVAAAIHTVDSMKLARDLGKRAMETPMPVVRRLEAGTDQRLPVLIEVNVGGEAQKSGCEPSAVPDIAQAIEAQGSLQLAGLMTVPPHTEDPSGARPFFDRLVELQHEHGGSARFGELSMGMSHDLEPAVQAGATFVRIGAAIFGAREA